MQRVLALAVMGLAATAACLAADSANPQEDAQVSGSALVRAAQQELYRLGCYSEPINGVWTQPSRAAAQKFLSRVNARLPVEQPDDALLALLRSTKGFVCSQCPQGEAFNSAGECVPKALADKAAKSAPVTTGALAEQPRSPEHPPGEELGSQRELSGQGTQTGLASSATVYFRALLRKVDRAFGLE
jgi:hypothetical protein